MRATRRSLLKISAAAAVLGGHGTAANAATTLKISHQFPGGTIDQGDFRDRLCRKFAEQVTTATGGALEFQVYPGSSLMKTNAQFSALRKGALDLSLYPLAYAGGEVKEVNIGLMPALVSTYEQAARWKTAPVGQELTKILADKGVIIVSWIWQAGGAVSRAKPLVGPDDAKGMKIRGGSREMDMMFKEAGAAILTFPSNELYAAMQTGAVDAATTSSTSLISFRLEELSKHLTSGRSRFYWCMLEPLLMSKAIFDGLTKGQQDAIMAAGADMEAFGTAAAQSDDNAVDEIYRRAGAEVHELPQDMLDKWRELAERSAWKDYADRSESCAELLKMAQAVSA